MSAASFIQFTGWMAALAVGLAVIAWLGAWRERRKAIRVFDEINRIRSNKGGH